MELATGRDVRDPAFAPRRRRIGRRSSDRPLTARQQQVLDAVSAGLENKQIAARLGVSEQAVKQQVSVLLRKFGVESRAMLVQQALAVRLVGRTVDVLDAPLELFFERAPIMMAISRGPRHEIRLVNSAFTFFFGERDYVGRTLADCFPGISEQLVSRLDRVFATGQSWRDSERYIRFELPDGTRRDGFLSLVVEAIRDGDGGAEGLAFYAWDVTEAVRTRRRLARMNREHQALLEQLPIGVIYTDERARPVLMNGFARRLWGFDLDPDQPLYTPIPGRIVRYAADGRPLSPDDAPSARAITGWPTDEDLLVTTGSVTRIVRVSARPLYDERGRVNGAALVFTERPAFSESADTNSAAS